MRSAPAPTLALASILLGTAACGGGDGPPLTVDNVCEEMATRYCDQDKPCCEKAGFTYNRDKCKAGYLGFCGSGTAAVRAGKARLDGQKVYDCLRSYQPFADKCFLGPEDRRRLETETAVCRQVFVGTQPLGAACEDGAECAAPSGGGSSTCSMQMCVPEGPPLREGAPCADGSGTSFCAPGLMCDFSATPPSCRSNPEPTPVVFAESCGAR